MRATCPLCNGVGKIDDRRFQEIQQSMIKRFKSRECYQITTEQEVKTAIATGMMVATKPNLGATEVQP